MSNDLTQKNAELGKFLFCKRYTLQPVKNSLYIAQGQDLKRGAVVDINGVLVGTNSLMPYAVLENDCDTRTKGAYASVFVKGEFNFDKLFFADGLSKEDLDNIVYNGSGIGLVIKPYDYEKGFSPLFSPSMFPAGTSQSNPLMNAKDVERMINAMKPIEAMTLRFEFSKKDYNPETAGVGSAGTWTKVDSPTLNVWDWTNENTDWSETFKGAFTDEDNEARVISAGDTSDVTLVNGMFKGLFEGEPGLNSYNLKHRNNIKECVAFDISGCTEFVKVFTGSALKSVPNFDFTNKDSVSFTFADTKIKEVGDLDFSGVGGLSEIVSLNSELVSVGTFIVTGTLKNVVGGLCKNPKLRRFGGFKGDMSNPNMNLQGIFQSDYILEQIDNDIDLAGAQGSNAVVAMFNGCRSLKRAPIKNLGSAITSIRSTFSSMRESEQLPNIDTHSVSNFNNAFSSCYKITTIPDYDVSSATDVSSMFKNCYNAKYGIYEMYQKLLARGSSITNHADAFKNCGSDTKEGRAALAQIPASWGGTAAG